MAVRTSTQAGNWSNTATWGGAAAPGDGDRAVINHAVTVDSAVTVGTSPVGSPTSFPSTSQSTGGSLTTGNFYILFYTHVDAGGNESLASPFGFESLGGSNTRISFTLPALPTGVSSYNLYAGNNSRDYRLQATGLGAGAYNFDTYVATAFQTGAAIWLQDSGRLTINANLTVKGEMLINGTGTVGDTIVTQAAGVTVTFNATGSASSTIAYQVLLGFPAQGMSSLFWKTNGTSGSRSAILSQSGGPNAYFSPVASSSGRIDLNYTDITRIGTASLNSFGIATDVANGNVVISNCVFNTCGRVLFASAVPGNIAVTIDNSFWQSTAHASECLRMSGATVGASAKVISGCAFDKTAFVTTNAITISGCMFGAGLVNTGSGIEALPISDCVLWADDVSSGAHLVEGDYTDCYFYAGGSDNPHFPLTANYTATIDGCIVEYGGAFVIDWGNAFYGPGTWTLQNCIILPAGASAGNEASGAITPTGGSTFTIIHCTLHSPSYNGGLLLGDGGATSDDFATVKSNLFWARLADADGVAAYAIDTTTADIITPANCTHNGLVNIAATAYQGNYPTTQPGANDVRLDSTDESTVFVDNTRNLASWAVTQGSVAGTYALKVADAKTYLLADPSLVASLLAHVRAGFVVKLAGLRTTAHDGTVIGAVQDAPPGGTILHVMNQMYAGAA